MTYWSIRCWYIAPRGWLMGVTQNKSQKSLVISRKFAVNSYSVNHRFFFSEPENCRFSAPSSRSSRRRWRVYFYPQAGLCCVLCYSTCKRSSGYVSGRARFYCYVAVRCTDSSFSRSVSHECDDWVSRANLLRRMTNSKFRVPSSPIKFRRFSSHCVREDENYAYGVSLSESATQEYVRPKGGYKLLNQDLL